VKMVPDAQPLTDLSTSPLVWLTATLGVFLIARRIARVSGNHPIANPILISILILAGMLQLSGQRYSDFIDGAQFIQFMLGPATVALGVPLWCNRRLILKLAAPILAALLIGSPFAVISAVLIAAWLGAPADIQLALVPKSATAGFAIGVARHIGAEPSLTATLVILTGIIGAIIVTPLMNALRISDYAARGFAVGLAAHGIGTVRANQVNTLAGTFSGLGMTLNGMLTAMLAPVLAGWLVG